MKKRSSHRMDKPCKCESFFWAIVSLAIMLLGFLAFTPDVLGAWPGLKQRFFHLGWSLWFIGLGRAFLRLPISQE